ncbi:hypothetical protein LCGC14_2195090 [marine sediment metagenome]|uniref:Uncharacterized protein n=1 Tax=marine sediment metagenome TaxID=412755 RepID=A0A0F9DIE2_9ZZZZ
MWESMEGFVDNKLKALKLPSFYGGRPVTELEQHRIDVLENIVQEFRLKKARKILEGV